MPKITGKLEYDVQEINIEPGVNGTISTVKKMIQFSKQDSINLNVISLARNIVYRYKANPRDNRAVADALFYWVKSNVRFVRDPATAEFVQAPHIVIEKKFGDCDDQATLLAALNLAVGNTMRFITIGKTNTSYCHVYIQVLDQMGRWISYDTVVANSYPTWEAPDPKMKMAFDLKGNYQPLPTTPTLSGINGNACSCKRKLVNELADFKYSNHKPSWTQNVKDFETIHEGRQRGDLLIRKLYPQFNMEDFEFPGKEKKNDIESKLLDRIEFGLSKIGTRDYYGRTYSF